MQHVHITFLCYFQLFSVFIFYSKKESIKISSSFSIFQHYYSPGLEREFKRVKA